MKEGWTYKRLGEVAYYPTERVSSEFMNEANYVGVDNLIKDRGGKTLANYVPSEGNTIEYKKGDVLLGNIRPYLKKIWLSDIDGGASGDVLIIRPNNSELLLPNYLYWVLASDHFFEYDTLHCKGAKMPRGNKVDIMNYPVPIPPFEVQKQIVLGLDLLRRTMEKQKAQMEELDKLAHSIFYDMFGDPVTNEKGWEVKTLKAISSKITNGNTPKGGSDVYVEEGILFLRSQNVWRNKIVFDDVAYIDDATHKMLHHSSLMHNDILITKTGRFNTENSSLGRAALYIGDDNMANINGHVYLVRLNPGIDKKYVLYILISESFRQLIRRVCVGGIDKRQLNKNHIEDFPIILPPLVLQQEFAAKVEAIEQMKAKVRQSLKETEELFNSRMDYYFN